MSYEISEKELAPQLALTYRTRATMTTIGEKISVGFGVLMEHAEKTGTQWAGPPFILYPEPPEGDYEILICMPAMAGAAGDEQVALEEIPGGRVATTMHVGPYEEVGEAYTALQKWMADNGCRPAGAPREVYLNEPGEVPGSELLTEVDWPIA
jgi:effector-binding domain-containing protein